MLEINVYNDFLKDMRSVARFDRSGRLLQNLALPYDKLLWPFQERFFGILRSVSVSHMLVGVGWGRGGCCKMDGLQTIWPSMIFIVRFLLSVLSD